MVLALRTRASVIIVMLVRFASQSALDMASVQMELAFAIRDGKENSVRFPVALTTAVKMAFVTEHFIRVFVIRAGQEWTVVLPTVLVNQTVLVEVFVISVA